jgi:hypothetical protein
MRWLAAALLGLVVPGMTIRYAAAAPADSTHAVADSSGSKFIDPADGWFDLSAFLDSGHGFVPLAIPITEPAVGYGVAGALVFINRNPAGPNGEYRRPNIWAAGGLYTENETWAGFAGHSGSWDDDRWQTLVGGIYGSINLDFYGIGEGELNDQPVAYSLDPAGALGRASYRVGGSPVILGLGYAFANIDVAFTGDLPAGIDRGELNAKVAGFTPSLTWDTRGNYFTPLTGLYASVEPGIYLEALGGSTDFERVNTTILAFQPVGKRVFLGIKGEGAFSFGDAPFYTRPFVSLRGVAALRYLGEHAASAELEARWQFYRRFSLVGFAGTGIAWTTLGDIDSHQDVVAGGGGIRYEIARRYGLHMGLDLAFGPDEGVVYVQFGHAWLKP